MGFFWEAITGWNSFIYDERIRQIKVGREWYSLRDVLDVDWKTFRQKKVWAMISLNADRSRAKCFAGSRKAEKLRELEQECYDLWLRKFKEALGKKGFLVYDGVSVTTTGVIKSQGRAVSARGGTASAKGAIENRYLSFRVGADEIVAPMSNKYACQALCDVINSVVRSQTQGQELIVTQKPDGKVRFESALKNLAILLINKDDIGRSRLQEFALKYSFPCNVDAFPDQKIYNSADDLIVTSRYLKPILEDIKWYHSKYAHNKSLDNIFHDYIVLSSDRGVFTPKQLFALYEFGMLMIMPLPAITRFIARAVAAEYSDLDREALEFLDIRDISFGEEDWLENVKTTSISDDVGLKEKETSAASISIPRSMQPLLSALGVTVLTGKADLRAAWIAAIQKWHPDKLPADAAPETRGEHHRKTTEINMAYKSLLDYLIHQA